MWNLKSNDTNELTYKTKRLLENELLVAGGEEIVKDFGKVMYTLLYSKWRTKDLLYKHMDLYTVLCASPDGSGVWGRIDTCLCMAESLCSPETTTALLTDYILM